MLEHYQILTLRIFLVAYFYDRLVLFIELKTWITACLSFSCWPLFLLSLHRWFRSLLCIQRWTEQTVHFPLVTVIVRGHWPDVGVDGAGWGRVVYPGPGWPHSQSVAREPPAVPGQVVQLPDSQNTKSDSMLNKNLRLLGRVFVVLVWTFVSLLVLTTSMSSSSSLTEGSFVLALQWWSSGVTTLHTIPSHHLHS